MSEAPETGVLYIYDPKLQGLIAYRPDYTTHVPFTVEGLKAQRSRAISKSPQPDKDVGVIVPMVRISPQNADWVAVATAAKKYPRVNVIAIISVTQDRRGIGLGVNSGPDPIYQDAIRKMQFNGVKVIGYVGTGNGAKDISDVKQEINAWKEFYPDIQGIFIDEVATPDSGYYVEIIQYAHSLSLFVAIDVSKIELGSNNTQPDADLSIIYENVGYPTDQWYAATKSHLSVINFPRSKFAMIPFSVEDNQPLFATNFVDRAVGTEKIAGYVYVQTTQQPNEKRSLAEWTHVSPFLETVMIQLDRNAQQEGIPSLRGVVPDTARVTQDNTPSRFFSSFNKVDEIISNAMGSGGTATPAQPAEQPTTQAPSPEPVAVEPKPSQTSDKFGVRQIYKTADTNKTWFINMDNPTSDSQFQNLPDKITKQKDGSWQTPKEPVRLEVWSKKGMHWLNVEVTGYFKALEESSSGNYLVQEYARGGHHFVDQTKWGDGACYKGRLKENGEVMAVKEIHHNAYTSNRAVTQATTQKVAGRWIGMKTIVYNHTFKDKKTNKDKTGVTMEIWIDDNVTDSKGNLVIKNDWKMIMRTFDEGGWSAKAYTSSSKKGFIANKYPRLDKDRTGQYRVADEIINMPGGNKEKNADLCAFRWDDALINFKYLSVREILPVRAD